MELNKTKQSCDFCSLDHWVGTLILTTSPRPRSDQDNPRFEDDSPTERWFISSFQKIQTIRDFAVTAETTGHSYGVEAEDSPTSASHTTQGAAPVQLVCLMRLKSMAPDQAIKVQPGTGETYKL